MPSPGRKSPRSAWLARAESGELQPVTFRDARRVWSSMLSSTGDAGPKVVDFFAVSGAVPAQSRLLVAAAGRLAHSACAAALSLAPPASLLRQDRETGVFSRTPANNRR